jgi:hypothetical protein
MRAQEMSFSTSENKMEYSLRRLSFSYIPGKGLANILQKKGIRGRITCLGISDFCHRKTSLLLL